MIQDYINCLKGCLEELSNQNIEEIADIIFGAWKNKKHVFIMGNGGSATTASHFARDLQVGTAVKGKPRVQAIGLTDNIALITALANDIDYNSVFEEQLIGQMGVGDVVIGISASGNSPNVLKAIEYARENGGVTIGFVGFGGGKLKNLVDKSIVLSQKGYRQVEDMHLCLSHMVTELVAEKLANA
jgi:D-sedoheptulose 7-phosphate isomerase